MAGLSESIHVCWTDVLIEWTGFYIYKILVCMLRTLFYVKLQYISMKSSHL